MRHVALISQTKVHPAKASLLVKEHQVELWAGVIDALSATFDLIERLLNWGQE